jgi:hypothetical protein
MFGLLLLGALSWAAALRATDSRKAEIGRADQAVLRRVSNPEGVSRALGLPKVEPAPAPRVWAHPGLSEPEPARPVADETDPVAELHARLVALEDEWPISFHEQASDALERFAEAAMATGSAGPEGAALVERLRGRADASNASLRVSGGLYAALGGLGELDSLHQRLPMGGEAQRSGLIGLAWEGTLPSDATGLVLHPARFLQQQPRAGVSVLDLALSRVPDAETAGWLRTEIVRPVDSLEELLSRELAVFALGTSVDLSAETRKFLRRLLFDTHPTVQRLRPAVSYVLANARGPEAREILMAWLIDPMVGAPGKTMARWWMAEGHAMPGDVDALIAPLLDPTSDGHERILAVGGLLRRLDRAGEAELQQIEEVLSMRIVTEENDTARLAAVTTLALASGGWQRLAALEHALRSDPKPATRGWAATGLGRTTTPYTGEAQAILRSAFSAEQDPSVRGTIQRALDP